MAVPATRAFAQTGRASTSINSAPKLTKVTPYVIRTPPPQWGGGTWFFVKLETDTGLVGWGETAVLNAFGGLTGSYKLMIQETFARYLEGKNPWSRKRFTTAWSEGSLISMPITRDLV